MVPLRTETLKHSLIYIAEEMGVSLRRSAYSPNIKERADHSCAILDAAGRIVAQAEHIPVHLGSLPLGLKETLNFLDREGVELREGDMVAVNDPFTSGTHLNDFTLIRPVFTGGRLRAFVANKAHHADIGGGTPGSISPDAREVWQEGFRLPPVKLMKAGVIDSEVLRVFLANVRMPRITLGDLRAQVAANLLGERRLAQVLEKFGPESFQGLCERLLEQTERAVRAEWGKLPRGEWEAEDYLELESGSPEPGGLARIRVKVALMGERVKVDFTGTDCQVSAPINAVLGVTVAASTFALKTLVPSEISLNDGFYRTVEVYAPPGSLVNASPPAPVSAGNMETAQRVVDAIYGALKLAVPERIPAASHGSMNNVMMGGVHPETGEEWAFYETVGGGYGGRVGRDGVDGVHVNMTNTLNTPIEVLEHYYPVVFEAYALRSDSGGPGRWRGGCGIERAWRVLAPVTVTLVGERHRVRPWGVLGGGEGAASEYVLTRRDGEARRLPSKVSVVLEAGDRIAVRTAGGGGYGDPGLRDREKVKSDLEKGLVSPAFARLYYGFGEKEGVGG